MQCPVAISPAAARQVRTIMSSKGIGPHYALRIGVRGGGCAGQQHFLGFDTPQQGDDQFEVEGLPVLVARSHTMFLLGLTLAWEETATARGFTFLTEEEYTERLEAQQ